ANLVNGAGSALCTDGSFNLVYCDAGSSTATLQSSYNLGNTITTSNNRSINFLLSDSAIDSNFYVEERGVATTAAVLINDTNAATNTLLALQSNGTTTFMASESGTLSLAGNNTADITTIIPGSSLTLQPIDNTAASGIGGDLVLSAGNATGATATGGNITL